MRRKLDAALVLVWLAVYLSDPSIPWVVFGVIALIAVKKFKRKPRAKPYLPAKAETGRTDEEYEESLKE
jgi:hypothetical protein